MNLGNPRARPLRRVRRFWGLPPKVGTRRATLSGDALAGAYHRRVYGPTPGFVERAIALVLRETYPWQTKVRPLPSGGVFAPAPTCWPNAANDPHYSCA